MFHVEQAWREALIDGAQALQISLASHQIEQFHTYLGELLAWNQKINLTSITETREIAIKHFLDSLAVSRALAGGTLLDIGSGAGFPGLPLKILDPDRKVLLLEPNRKKTAFLHHLIGTLQLSGISVVSTRLEEFSHQNIPGPRIFMNIVTRALAIIPWLKHIQPLLAEDGRLIWCRADRLDLPVQEAGFIILREHSYALPGGFGDRVLIVLQKR